jgi:hypothetical protein
VIDLRQGVVRIGLGVAMAGEMLGAGQYVVLLHAFGVGNAFLADIDLTLAKTAGANNGVGRIAVHIHGRGEVDVHAHALDLTGHFFAKSLDECVVLDGAKRHLARIADGAVEAHAEAPFRIHGNEHGQFGARLQVVAMIGLPQRPALKVDEPAYAIVVDKRVQLGQVLCIPIAVGSNHE